MYLLKNKCKIKVKQRNNSHHRIVSKIVRKSKKTKKIVSHNNYFDIVNNLRKNLTKIK